MHKCDILYYNMHTLTYVCKYLFIVYMYIVYKDIYCMLKLHCNIRITLINLMWIIYRFLISNRFKFLKNCQEIKQKMLYFI